MLSPAPSRRGHLVLGLNRPSDDGGYTLAVTDVHVDHSISRNLPRVSTEEPPSRLLLETEGSIHGRLINSLPDFGGLASVIAHDTILLYDVMNKSLSTIVGLVDNGNTACYFESESLLVVPEYSADPMTNDVIRVLRIESESSISPVFEFLPATGHAEAIACNESFLSLGIVVGGGTRNLDCYDLNRDGSLRWKIPSPANLDEQGVVFSLALDPVDGSRLIVSANADSQAATVFDIRTLSEVGTLGVDDIASSLLWHLDHPHCCIFAGGDGIRFFDLRNPSVPYRQLPSGGFDNHLAHIDSGRFASCLEYFFDDTGGFVSQGLLQIWDFDTGKLLMEEKTDGECFSVCFCPDDDGGWGRRGEREDEEERIRFAFVTDEGRDREEEILPALLVVSHGFELFVSKFWTV